jgi:hypothetical protein
MSVPHRAASTLDLVETASRMIDAAVAVTTGRLQRASVQETRQLLLRSDATALTYFRFELARQVAVMLVMMDPQVVAVFEDQDVPEAEEVAPPAPTLADPIRLIVHAEFETVALTALVRAVNDALSRAISDAFLQPPDRLVQTTIVDDRHNRLLRARAFGFRPAPIMLAARDETFTDGTPD